MFIVPLGVIWAGYSLVWYGFSLVKGPGMGFTDLIFPSRVAKAEQVIKGWSKASVPASAKPQTGPGSTIGGVGTTPGPAGSSPTNPLITVPGSPQAQPRGTTVP